MGRLPAGNDFDGWVAQLGTSSRRRQARLHLLEAGQQAVPAVRRGLRHRKAVVRQMCAAILDQLADEQSWPDLVAAIDDDDPKVCARALHTLACDPCKKTGVRPADELFVPRALSLVAEHPDPDVRAAAVDALGKVAARRPDVAAALATVAERDPHPGIRNMARNRAR